MPTTRENIDNKIKLSATRKNAGYQGKRRQQRKMCVARENVGKIGKCPQQGKNVDNKGKCRHERKML